VSLFLPSGISKDELSSAASVIAGLELAGSLAKLCARYIQDAKDAPDNIITLQRTISELEGIFQRLKSLLGEPPTFSSVVISRILGQVLPIYF
jgi:hypothetical protein